MARKPYKRSMRTETRTPDARPSAPAAEGRDAREDAALPPDFEQWYHDHRTSVYRYVRFRVATRETAEDVTSEVFMKALRSLHRYDQRRASPRTWLLRIARNAVTDHLRSLRRRGSLHVSLDRIPDLVSQADSQEERVLKEERIQTLLNGTRTLRPADQEILSLRYGAGLSNGEIAETLGITPNAVAVRLHRVLRRLKEAVAEMNV
ncbi:MAG: sigma-70 family RNA polymerase sigma factor [Gemmatimonadetes bacterium]|nr:MAG: sigma-70 family RNA polymerase sigma factor [Gemmatimonadota bacterium]